MAAMPLGLGAHDRRAPLARPAHEALERGLELGRLHVVRVALERPHLQPPFGESGAGLRNPPSAPRCSYAISRSGSDRDSASAEKCGMRREPGNLRTSTRRSTPWRSSRLTKRSSSCVECPTVKTLASSLSPTMVYR